MVINFRGLILLPKPSSSSLAFFHHHRLRCLLGLSTTADVCENPSPKIHFMAEYLVTSFGFSTEKAAEASKRLNRIKSPQQLESVLDFFRIQGFEETQIRKLISWYPRCLCLNVEKTLETRFRSLQDLGFSGSDLIDLILSYPSVLNHNIYRTVLPKIELWRDLLGSNELLLNFIRKNKNHRLLGYSVERTIRPNLKLLDECGISDQRISMFLKSQPIFILLKPNSFKVLVERVEGLGIPRHSGMFLRALRILRMISNDKFKARLELMKSLGWSESEFFSAIRKTPIFLYPSEKMMREKMEFLVKEAGCKTSYLALNPELLSYSLVKRMIPRHRVMQILKSRGLHCGEYNISTIIRLPEKNFMEKYVLPHEEKFPELQEVYVSSL